MLSRRRFLTAIAALGGGAPAAHHAWLLRAASLPDAKAAKPVAAPSVPVRYTDVTGAAGIDFKQDATATEQKYYLETMGTGLGWIDYDQNGLIDLYFVQSAAT